MFTTYFIKISYNKQCFVGVVQCCGQEHVSWSQRESILGPSLPLLDWHLGELDEIKNIKYFAQLLAHNKPQINVSCFYCHNETVSEAYGLQLSTLTFSLLPTSCWK